MKFNFLKKNKKIAETAKDAASANESGAASMKALGMIGAGVAGAFLFSDTANAMTGSARVTQVSSVKNSNGVKINPATEGTLANVNSSASALAASTATLVTTTATSATNSAAFATNAANIPTKQNLTMANSMPVAIASNQTVNVFGNMAFANVSTAMAANATDPLFYLRKISKQLESRSTMDAAKRQRVYVDGISSSAIQLSTGISPVAGYDQKMYQYSSRNAFADGIRRKLKFS